MNKEMKCPKCDSNNYRTRESALKHSNMHIKKEYECQCGHRYDEVDTEYYKQRLSDVLGKMTSEWDSQYPYKELLLDTRSYGSLINKGTEEEYWADMTVTTTLYREDSTAIFYLMTTSYRDNELLSTDGEFEVNLTVAEELIMMLEAREAKVKKIYIQNDEPEKAAYKLRGLKSGTTIYVDERLVKRLDYPIFGREARNIGLIVKTYNYHLEGPK